MGHPHALRDDGWVIDNLAEEVLGTTSKSGFGHLHWLFEFTRALGAPDEVITEATPNIDAMACSSFLYRLAHQRPWYELTFGGILAIENQIPPAYIGRDLVLDAEDARRIELARLKRKLSDAESPPRWALRV